MRDLKSSDNRNYLMKVILQQDISHLGKKHDIREIRNGYARNFLISRGLAKPATASALKALAVQKELTERERSGEYQKYKAMAEKLRSLVLYFKVKIGEKGRSFGSVTAVKIRDTLEKQGIEVEKDWILLEEPIKTMGEQLVKIKFPKEVKGEVKVMVEAE